MSYLHYKNVAKQRRIEPAGRNHAFAPASAFTPAGTDDRVRARRLAAAARELCGRAATAAIGKTPAFCKAGSALLVRFFSCTPGINNKLRFL